MDGILNILKPPGMTSHDVVSFARKVLGTKKIGHTGTLDPGVAGVLVLCVGKATRLAEYILETGKTYRGEITLGLATDTQDSFGKIIEEKKDFNITLEQLTAVLVSFQGTIKQIPPMYSALKHKGKKLYELAREGQEIVREAREVEIKSLKMLTQLNECDILKFKAKLFFEVECSKGTYVRTLCADIGSSLGCGGYMSYLIRTSVGKFQLAQACTLEELKELREKALHPLSGDILELKQIIVNKQGQEKLSHGIAIGKESVVTQAEKETKQEELAVLNQAGMLLAIVKQENNFWKPIKVLC